MSKKPLPLLVLILILVSLYALGCGGQAPQQPAKKEVAKAEPAKEQVAADKQKKWPDKPIEVIINSAPGGAADTTMRVLGGIWSEYLGVPITYNIIDGASGQVGLATYLKDRKKEGYSLLTFSLGTMAFAQRVQPVKGLSFDYSKDLAYLGTHAIDPGVLVTPKSTPYDTLEKFIAAAKQKKMRFGITRFAQVDTLSGLQLAEQTGAKLELIPHAGNDVLKPALAGGHLDAAIAKVSPMYSIRDSLRFIATLYPSEYPRDSFAYSPVLNKVLGTSVTDVINERCLAVHAAVKADYPDRYQILKDTYDKARTDPRYIKAAVEKLGYFENMVGKVGEQEGIIRYAEQTDKLIDKYKNLLEDEAKQQKNK